MNNILKQHAQTLHLSGLLDSLQLRLQEAEANRLPYAQFLELLLQDEINVRHQRLINRRHKLAEFRELRSLENFDFSFNPTINRALIYELATGQFVAQRRDPVQQNRRSSKYHWSRPGLSRVPCCDFLFCDVCYRANNAYSSVSLCIETSPPVPSLT